MLKLKFINLAGHFMAGHSVYLYRANPVSRQAVCLTLCMYTIIGAFEYRIHEKIVCFSFSDLQYTSRVACNIIAASLVLHKC